MMVCFLLSFGQNPVYMPVYFIFKKKTEKEELHNLWIYMMLPCIRSGSCFRKSLCQKDYRKVFLSVVPYVKIKLSKDVQPFGSTEGCRGWLMIEYGELCLSCGENCIFHFLWRGRELDKRFYFFNFCLFV